MVNKSGVAKSVLKLISEKIKDLEYDQALKIIQVRLFLL